MTVTPRLLAEAIIGSFFVAIALAAAAAGASARPKRAVAPLWFSLFTVLYGLRLLSRSALVQAATPWPPEVFRYADPFITYMILVPMGCFVETILGSGWHRIIRRTWQVTLVIAIVAIVMELVRGQPGSSMAINAPLVLLTVAIQLPHLVRMARRGWPWPREGWLVTAALALFTGVALFETLSQRRVLPGIDAEPLAMLLLIAALGWFVLVRARDESFAFVALSRELELARRIQESLLPQQMPNVPGVKIDGTYLPMSAVAGDFYDIVQLHNGHLAVIVADVSGHGVPAALVASMVKLAFATATERHDRPGEILTSLNNALTGKFERAYVTACVAVVDPRDESLAYAAAGHPPPLLRRDDGRVERLEQGGVALALLPVAKYATAEIVFGGGDRLVLYTDGLLEGMRAGSDEFFGDAELARVVATAPPSGNLSERLLEAYRAWTGGGALTDDVTLVIVERSH